MRIYYTVEQTLDAQLPQALSDEDIENAVSTIESPDPCLVYDAPSGLVLQSKVEMCEVSVENGAISATRTLLFTLQITDLTTFEQWCTAVGQEQDSDLLPSYLFEDYEGSTIGDEMVDYESTISVILDPSK